VSIRLICSGHAAAHVSSDPYPVIADRVLVWSAMKEQLMPVETRFGRSVQPSGADTLAALIPELVVALEAGGAPVKGFFEPGVSRNIVERALAPLG
jgi:hypothetical protein